ncbi:MAG: hypothetical protein KDE67_04695, partial [Sphingobium sp.]|nr:hypothetical protein [Sphingobium sp.]
NCAPLMMVARLARDSGVKGLLSGEGSDECFLGYPWLGRKALTDRYHSYDDCPAASVGSLRLKVVKSLNTHPFFRVS